MKFKKINYPFIELIRAGEYFKIPNLMRAINYLGILNLSEFEIQYYASTYLQDCDNSIDSLLDVFSYLKPCSGCIILQKGLAVYYQINPKEKEGLKFIAIVNNDLYALDALKDLSMKTDLDKFYSQDLLLEVLKQGGSKVISYGKSIDFVYEIRHKGKEKYPSFLIEYDIIDCIKSGLYSSQTGTDMLTKMFYQLWIENLFAQTVKTQVHIIGERDAPKKVINQIKFISDFPIRVFVYDRTYYTEFRSLFPVHVKEFERWQACGKGWKDRKRTPVRAHERKGRISRAKKDLNNIKQQ